MADQLEFEERDVWGEALAGDSASGGGESSSEKDGAAQNEDSSRKRGASSSSSSEDAEYDEQLEENIRAFRGTGPGAGSIPVNFAQGSLRGRPRSRRESLDEDAAAVTKLGTSLPINIPTLGGRRSRNSGAEEKPDKASTFVPPHLIIEQPDARVGLSLSSASSAKREKLLQRNAILRRTGFIEAGTRASVEGRGALPELLDPLNRRMMPIKESHLEPSALSAALGSPQSKQQGQ